MREFELVAVSDSEDDDDFYLMLQSNAVSLKKFVRDPSNINLEEAYILIRKWLKEEVSKRIVTKNISDNNLQEQSYWGIKFADNIRDVGQVIGYQFVYHNENMGCYRIDCDLFNDRDNDLNDSKIKGEHFNASISIRTQKKKYAFKFGNIVEANKLHPRLKIRKGHTDITKWRMNHTKMAVYDYNNAGYVNTMPLPVAQELMKFFNNASDGNQYEEYLRLFDIQFGYPPKLLRTILIEVAKRTVQSHESSASLNQKSNVRPVIIESASATSRTSIGNQLFMLPASNNRPATLLPPNINFANTSHETLESNPEPPNDDIPDDDSADMRADYLSFC